MSAPLDATYSARLEQVGGVGVVRLRSPSGTRVSIVPEVGNNAVEFLVNGKNALWFPHSSIGEFAASPELCGNPFLAPWANRLDEHAFYANGIRYELSRGLGNYQLDLADQPIHGLLLYADHWEVVDLRSGQDSARVTSRLEFGRYPQLMAQFPLAHTIEMTYILRGEMLETRTKVLNRCAETIPLSVGYHPYFQLHDSERDFWHVRLAAESVWNLNEKFTPTGERAPIGEVFPQAGDLSLRGQFLDHVFDGLQRDGDGWSRFHVRGARERITVEYGAGFPVAVVYAPTGNDQSFVCFEPMSGITNAFNLAQRGLYSGLSHVPSGQTWEASFRISVEGF